MLTASTREKFRGQSHIFGSIERALAVLSCLLLISCAGQVAPSGGPVDAIPPDVFRTEPDTNSVRVETDRIVLEFTEYVDRRSVEESIFISPYVGAIEFDWSGREVTLLFADVLRQHTTYVVTVGTDVRDVRASNRMAHAFTLAFSTGDSIDKGTISGKVFAGKPEGVMMFAYVLDGMKPDTLNPNHTKPDYITQTGQDGAFAFSNLRLGTYRVFAVRDEFRNLMYDKQTDQFGVSTRDVVLRGTDPTATGLQFRLSSEDTTRPFITKVVPLNRGQLLVRFSEQIDTASVRSASCLLSDTLGGNPSLPLLTSVDRNDSLALWILTSGSLDSGRVYQLAVRNIADTAGNRIDSLGGTARFTGVANPDTMKASVVIAGMSDSTKGVPHESTFEVRFSEPVRQATAASAISLLDSAGRVVTCTKHWSTPTSLLLKPAAPLESKRWYAIRAVMDSVQDFEGNRWKDSARVIHFETLDLRTTGTVEGYVLDPDSARGDGEIVITASRVLTGTAFEQSRRLKESGKFRFEQLPEGQYTFRAFRDRDSSLAYSYGLPYPFHTSERFAVGQDTVKVRARWGVEGVMVKFPVSTR